MGGIEFSLHIKGYFLNRVSKILEKLLSESIYLYMYMYISICVFIFMIMSKSMAISICICMYLSICWYISREILMYMKYMYFRNKNGE